MMPGEDSAGDFDAFVARYGANGTFEWVRQFGTDLREFAVDVAATGSAAYILGWTTADRKTFLRKYDQDGGLLWHRDTTLDQAKGVETDEDGNAYVFGPSLTGEAVYIRRYDPHGGVDWTHSFPRRPFQEIGGLSVKGGRAAIAGLVIGKLPGQSRKGREDAFVRLLALP